MHGEKNCGRKKGESNSGGTNSDNMQGGDLTLNPVAISPKNKAVEPNGAPPKQPNTEASSSLTQGINITDAVVTNDGGC